MVAVGNMVIQLSLQCLVEIKMKIYHLMFNGGSRECGHSGKSVVSGGNKKKIYHLMFNGGSRECGHSVKSAVSG